MARRLRRRSAWRRAVRRGAPRPAHAHGRARGAHAVPGLPHAGQAGLAQRRGAGARPALVDAGLESTPGLSGRRGVSRVPQDPLAGWAQVLAGDRTRHRPRRQAALRSRRGAVLREGPRGPLRLAAGPDRGGAAGCRRHRRAVRHGAVRPLVVRRRGLHRGALPPAARLAGGTPRDRGTTRRRAPAARVAAPHGRVVGRRRRLRDVAQRRHRLDVEAAVAARGGVLGRGAGGAAVGSGASRARAGGARAAACPGVGLAVHHVHRCGDGLRRAALHPPL